MQPRTARWMSRLVLAIYGLLIMTGLLLQLVSQQTYLDWGIPFLLLIMLFPLMWCGLGALIIHRQPLHPVGWILLLVMAGLGPEYTSFGLLVYRDHLSAAPPLLFDLSRIWLAWSGSPFALLGFTLLLLVFPTGRPLSRRWGRVGWLSVLATAGYLLVAPLSPAPLDVLGAGSPLAVRASIWAWLQLIYWLSLAVVFVCLLLAVVSLVARLRRSQGEERQQLKWFVFAAAFLPLHVPPMVYAIGADFDPLTLYLAVGFLMFAGLAMVLAVGFAIFRYRLYDIDFIINRTLVYGVVTGTLAMIYFASVLLLQGLFRALAGQHSPAAVIGSTLLIYVLFQPLRRRVQRYVDQRFYRARYDAERLLEGFGVQLRDEVDPEAVTRFLLEAVQGSLQPAHLSIWLGRSAGLGTGSPTQEGAR